MKLRLGLILFLGAFLRLHDLASNPLPEAFADEINQYVPMHSIMTTGHDLDGTLQPFFYCTMTRNPPIYAISAYLSTLVFGNTPFGLRFPAVLFGLATILAIAALTHELTRRKDAALLAAAFVAIEPIYVHFSRVAWEPASELPFLLGGLYALLRAARSSASFEWLALGALLLGITAYTYQGAWFYAILLGGTLLMLIAPRLASEDRRARIGGTLAIWAAISTPALSMFFTDPHTSWRAQWMATFGDGISQSSLHVFTVNYQAHLTWSYLFVRGAIPKYLAGFGLFYWWIAPLCAVGLLFGASRLQPPRMALWLWIWLLVYPLGGALTNDGAIPNTPRTLAGSPVFCIAAAIGTIVLFDLARRWRSRVVANAYRLLLGAALGTAATISSIAFCTFYFGVYPHAYASDWDSGTASTFALTRRYAPRYERACFVGFHPMRIEMLAAYYLADLRIPKITNIGDPACSQSGTLLVAVPSSFIPNGFTPLAYSYDLNGKPYAAIEARAERAAP